MKIKVVSMNGDVSTYDVKSFEMRANQVTNWVKLTLTSDDVLTIHRVATLKMERGGVDEG